MVQRRKLVYLVLFGINASEETNTSIYGIFSKEQKALDAIPEHDEDLVSYFVVEAELDVPFEGITPEEVQDELINLMNQGLVEQLVDEDGNFVYIAVDKKDDGV